MRAEKLIGGLGGEKDRWGQVAVDLQIAYDNLLGDVLVSAGTIAYLGPFTSAFRDKCTSEWVRACKVCLLCGRQSSFHSNLCACLHVVNKNLPYQHGGRIESDTAKAENQPCIVSVQDKNIVLRNWWHDNELKSCLVSGRLCKTALQDSTKQWFKTQQPLSNS